MWTSSTYSLLPTCLPACVCACSVLLSGASGGIDQHRRLCALRACALGDTSRWEEEWQGPIFGVHVGPNPNDSPHSIAHRLSHQIAREKAGLPAVVDDKPGGDKTARILRAGDKGEQS